MTVKLDLYDRKILYELDIDAMISATKLGKKIQLPKESVNYRIKRLLQRKIITYFYTQINSSMFGFNYYRVSIELNKLKKEEENTLLDFLLQNHSCTNIRLTDGDFNLVFLTAHESIEDFKKFLSGFGSLLGEKIIQRNISLVTRSQVFNLQILHKGENVRKTMDHAVKKSIDLDYRDQKLLSYIALNGRARLTEMSKKIRIEPKIIRYKLNRLSKSKIIVGTGFILNHKKLELNFIQIDFIFKDPLTSVYVLEFFNSTHNLIRSYELLGKYDLSIELLVESDNMLMGIIDKFKEKLYDWFITF